MSRVTDNSGAPARNGAGAEQPGAWAGARWLSAIERAADPQTLAEGVELARLGRVRELTFAKGATTGVVQEKPRFSRAASLAVATLPFADWERATAAMADQAVIAAKLLAGEMPASIEDLFEPLGLALFPTEAEHVKPSCACNIKSVWCKHACALAAAVAQRLDREPFVIFELRGITSEDLIDHLRARRALLGDSRAAGGASGGRRLGPLGGAELDPGPPLESCLDAFWTMGPGLEDLDLTPRRPEAPHALLRRLGPSPFPKGGFPLIGLLASAYDAASESAVRQAGESTEPGMD